MVNRRRCINWVSTCICENGKYLKSIVDDSKIGCDEIIYIMDTVSTNVTSTKSANAMSTMLTNSDDKKVRYKMDCYILQTILLVIILIFKIAIICYQFGKHRSKQKGIEAKTIQKWRIMKSKKFVLKIVCVIISMISIIKFKNFDFDNI